MKTLETTHRAAILRSEFDHLPQLASWVYRAWGSADEDRNVIEALLDANGRRFVSNGAVLSNSWVRDGLVAAEICRALQLGGGARPMVASEARRTLWHHGFTVGHAAEWLGANMGPFRNRHLAFSCGLFHDLGKAAMHALVPKSYERILLDTHGGAEFPCDAEHALLGFDHTQVGFQVALAWKLPRSIIDCAGLHHSDYAEIETGAEEPMLVKLVRLANTIVRLRETGWSGHHSSDNIRRMAENLGLSIELLEIVPEPNRQSWYIFEQILGLHEPLAKGKLLRLAGENNVVGENRSRKTVSHLSQRTTQQNPIVSFTELITQTDRSEETCTAAALCAREAAGADWAICVALSDGGRLLRVGAASNQCELVTTVLEATNFVVREDAAMTLSYRVSNQHPSVRLDIEAIWMRCGPTRSPGALCVLEIESDPEFAAFLILESGQRTEDNPGRIHQELAPLVAVVKLALRGSRKQTESAKAHEELVHLQRKNQKKQTEESRRSILSRLAEMSAGAAHELNTPLAVISGRAQMALSDTRDPEIKRVLEIIVQQAHRASGIVTELMDFAKPDPPQPQTQRVRDLVEAAVVRQREVSMLGGREIDASWLDAHATVYADPAQVDEVLDAILSNAVAACPQGAVRVQVNSASRASDETCRIVIEDRGAGMSPHQLEHAVDPFYSSRRAGRGRGLGLSRAARLIEINGGRLRIESRLGTGTRVSLDLPARRMG